MTAPTPQMGRPGGRWLAINLHQIGDDHVAHIRDASDEDLDHVESWLRSMRTQNHVMPEVVAVRPRQDSTAPRPTTRLGPAHPDFTPLDEARDA